MAFLLVAGVAAAPLGVAHAQASSKPRVKALGAAQEQRAKRERPAVVRVEWKVPSRLEQSWAAWNGRSYDLEYVNPASWSVNVDLCGSTGGENPIEEYSLTLRGVGFGYASGSHNSACMKRFHNLPKLGKYEVTVKIRTREGWSAPHTEIIDIQDWLIAIIGDSMSSGEGNPDEPGNPAHWEDRRCHRSARSGPVLAAKQLEASDPHSSVTLIDLACSGAKITSGLLKPYEGQEPPKQGGRVRDHRDLPPQVDVLARLVGSGSTRGERKIDALLTSVGVNDLGFSSIARACAKNIYFMDNCVGELRSEVDRRMTELPANYARLANRLEQDLDIAEVYIAEYPADPVGGGGCGKLGIPALGIDKVEASWISGVGGHLNSNIRKAAELHGWNYVGGMTEAFHHHAYCDAAPYLIGYTESSETQGNEDGTLHPNHLGHRAFKDLLLGAVVLGQATPIKRVTLTITQVKVGDVERDAQLTPDEIEEAIQKAKIESKTSGGRPSPSPGHPPAGDDLQPGVSIYVSKYQNDLGNSPRRFRVPAFGRYVNLPADKFTYILDIYPTPSPPRYPVAVHLTVLSNGAQVNGHYEAKGNYGKGAHEAVHPTGKLSVKYTIQVQDLGLPASTAAPAAVIDRH